MKSSHVLIAILSVFSSALSFADNADCLGLDGKPTPNSNTEVLNWLHTTPNNFLARAYVQGSVVKRYPDETNHAHFSIDLNGDGVGDLEVIYQYDAGSLPNITPGMKVTSCGDYITLNHSPNGGIIHWVHCNSRTGTHPDGFVSVDGAVFGFSPTVAGEKCLRSTPDHF